MITQQTQQLIQNQSATHPNKTSKILSNQHNYKQAKSSNPFSLVSCYSLIDSQTTSHPKQNKQNATSIFSLHITNPPQAKYRCSSKLFLQRIKKKKKKKKKKKEKRITFSIETDN
jgi:hypothetical protein